MVLFWFFAAYFVKIRGKLSMRMKFVSRHVGSWMSNFFLTVLRLFEIIMNCFQIRHNFQLVYILSFQKRYTCPKKIFGTLELFKKTWSQIPLLSANFDFRAQLFHEIFKISNPKIQNSFNVHFMSTWLIRRSTIHLFITLNSSVLTSFAWRNSTEFVIAWESHNV